MATAPAVPRLTYDDLTFVRQAREGDRHELFAGELVVTSSPVPAHQIVSDNIVHSLNVAIRPNRLGRVFAAPIDIKFTPTIVAVPDVVYIRWERLDIVGQKAIEGTPDLIVEILSPSTRRRDLGTKRALYERFGVPEYWIVDPRARRVTVHVLRGDQYEPLSETGTVRSTVLPELAIQVEELFAGV
jgi:Uma2 family endonuclease